jgi:hypothetical protein
VAPLANEVIRVEVSTADGSLVVTALRTDRQWRQAWLERDAAFQQKVVAEDDAKRTSKWGRSSFLEDEVARRISSTSRCRSSAAQHRRGVGIDVPGHGRRPTLGFEPCERCLVHDIVAAVKDREPG